VRGLAHREGVALDEPLRVALGNGDGLHEVGSPVVAPLVVEGEEGEGEEEGEENENEGNEMLFHCWLIIRRLQGSLILEID